MLYVSFMYKLPATIRLENIKKLNYFLHSVIYVFLLLSSPFLLSTPMMEVENFTIFIKNSIRFPTFDYTK